jgi:hypothetical protein
MLRKTHFTVWNGLVSAAFSISDGLITVKAVLITISAASKALLMAKHLYLSGIGTILFVLATTSMTISSVNSTSSMATITISNNIVAMHINWIAQLSFSKK